MKDGEAKEVKIPWEDNATLLVNRSAEDVYKGNIVKDGQIVHKYELCSIPQLGAHLTSFSELYDELDEESSEESSVDESSAVDKKLAEIDNKMLQMKLQSLEDKINQLFLMIANNNNDNKISIEREEFVKEHKKLVDVLRSPSHKDDMEEAKEQSKELKEVLDKSEELDQEPTKNILRQLLKLQKGLAPTMPAPPAPGTNVGGNQGKTKSGIRTPKLQEPTVRSVSQQKDYVKNPYLKPIKAPAGQPKQPAQPKNVLTVKSEPRTKCNDCGEPLHKDGKYVGCSCFKSMTPPELKKNQNGSVTFTFKYDWDKDTIAALYKTLVRK
jgi:hypothetical protein